MRVEFLVGSDRLPPREMKLSPDKLMAGVLEPVFAIRTENDLGVGDVDGVRQMIDWCHRYKLNLFQTLPINEISDDNSPYNAISSLAIEPTTLALSPEYLPDLAATRIQEVATPSLLAELRKGSVKYARVKPLKRALLEMAFDSFFKRHFEPNSSRAMSFRAFIMGNADWLSDYALFRVLMEENGNSPAWDKWQPMHQGPRRARTWLLSLPVDQRDALMHKQLFFCYVQWVAFAQWQEVKAYGSEKQVYLMGDMPFGVSRYSADVWANRHYFDLDWSGGAPPERVFKSDPFTAKWGQNWGIPNYRWDEFRRHDFEWWRRRVDNLRKVFHLYRIDHVLGFFRIYSFPWTPDRNAEFLPLNEHEAAQKTGGRLPGFKPFPDEAHEQREANRVQGEAILRVVLESSGETTVVAEDLGCVPDYVHPTLQRLGVPGFRIPQFFRDADGSYSDPGSYPRLSLAQPTTHDHSPLAATWAELQANIKAGQELEQSRRELEHVMKFAGLNSEKPPREFGGALLKGYVRAVMESNSWLVVFQITDIFGQSERFNTPGSAAEANWSHRLARTVKELRTDRRLAALAANYSNLAKASGRRA